MSKLVLFIITLNIFACNSVTDKKMKPTTLLVDSSKTVQPAKPVEEIKEDLITDENVIRKTDQIW